MTKLNFTVNFCIIFYAEKVQKNIGVKVKQKNCNKLIALHG